MGIYPALTPPHRLPRCKILHSSALTMSKPPVNVAVPQPLQKQQQQQKPGPQNLDSGEWTDEKLVDALKRLDDLHTKVRSRTRFRPPSTAE